ncbi:MAG: hypothetical protein QM699_16945 [Amaricoccus sp.]|uniref:hypothetical protein n=1 Tax=Amaricoccus sp. TaxID=1872485 RepID=UPI0039E4E50F
MGEPEDRRHASSTPGTAAAEAGVVIFDGPQGAVATLTPEAAAATSENLRRAARAAAEQRQTGPEPVKLGTAGRDD